MDTGNNAWVLTSAALILFMTPGLAFFYGGMVRSKNVLGMLMQNVFAMGLISVIWAVLGFTLAFGGDSSLLGNLDHKTAPVWVLLLFVVGVGTMITFALITGALRHISATKVGITAMVEPVTAGIIAWLWLGETFGLAQLVGAAVVLAAIALAQTAR